MRPSYVTAYLCLLLLLSLAGCGGGVRSATLSRQWRAWIDETDPAAPTLHVRGAVVAPHAGYEATATALRPTNSRGRLLLLVSLEERLGTFAWSSTAIPVDFELQIDAVEVVRVQHRGRGIDVRVGRSPAP